jgi:hypothetical protein
MKKYLAVAAAMLVVGILVGISWGVSEWHRAEGNSGSDINAAQKLAPEVITVPTSREPAPKATPVRANAPIDVENIWNVTGTTVDNLYCWTQQSTGMVGLAHPGTVDFDARYVCDPLVEFVRTGQLTTLTLEALTTIGHEAAHLRGVYSESKAECLGIRFAYGWLDRYDVFARYDRNIVREYLYDNEDRGPAYKLQDTCSAVEPFSI